MIDKIEKQNLNYDLTEKYKRITKLQEEQNNLIKEGQLKRAIQLNDIQLKQAEQLQAIGDQTNLVGNLALRPTPFHTHLPIQHEPQYRIVDDEINTAITGLTTNHLTAFDFRKYDGEFSVNGKHFEINDKKLTFNDPETGIHSFDVTPNFFSIFRRGRYVGPEFDEDELKNLESFVKYAGGLGPDTQSKLYQILSKLPKPRKKRKIEGRGVSFIFRSSDPNVFVERLEVLAGESLAGNTDAYREASAILHELLRMGEVTKQEYETGMKIFMK